MGINVYRPCFLIFIFVSELRNPILINNTSTKGEAEVIFSYLIELFGLYTLLLAFTK